MDKLNLYRWSLRQDNGKCLDCVDVYIYAETIEKAAHLLANSRGNDGGEWEGTLVVPKEGVLTRNEYCL